LAISFRYWLIVIPSALVSLTNSKIFTQSSRDNHLSSYLTKGLARKSALSPKKKKRDIPEVYVIDEAKRKELDERDERLKLIDPARVKRKNK